MSAPIEPVAVPSPRVATGDVERLAERLSKQIAKLARLAAPAARKKALADDIDDLLARLTRALAEREQDSTRLDWLGEVAAPYMNRDRIDYWNGRWSHVDPEANELLTAHDSLREAIDAATTRRTEP